MSASGALRLQVQVKVQEQQWVKKRWGLLGRDGAGAVAARGLRVCAAGLSRKLPFEPPWFESGISTVVVISLSHIPPPVPPFPLPLSHGLRRQKNREGTMIVLYDNDERVAAPLATLFYDKGFDNVYLLSGGLRVVGNKFPLMLDGDLPEELVEKPAKGRSSSGRSVVGPGGSDARSVMSGASTPSRRGPGSVASRRSYRP